MLLGILFEPFLVLLGPINSKLLAAIRIITILNVTKVISTIFTIQVIFQGKKFLKLIFKLEMFDEVKVL